MQGGPMAGPYGAAPMMPAGGFGGGGMSNNRPRGEMRNPVMVLVLSMLCCFYALFALWSMLSELQNYTNDEDFQPWHIFVPILGIYFLWVKVPEQINKAKQMAGSRNPQNAGIVLYIFIPYFALAKDLNEVWDPNLS